MPAVHDPLPTRHPSQPEWGWEWELLAYRNRLKFKRRNGLTERAYSNAGYAAILRSTGYSEKVIRAARANLGVATRYVRTCGYWMDHPRIYGRKRQGPVCLLASPYGIRPCDVEEFQFLRLLGLTVEVREDLNLYQHPEAIDVLVWAKGHGPDRR